MMPKTYIPDFLSGRYDVKRALAMRFVDLPGAVSGYLFRKCLDKQRSSACSRGLPFEDQEEETAHEPVIVCRQCRNRITDESQRLSIDGANRHTFANPHGHVYDIACFASAAGCRGAGPPSGEFTWFKGYSWQVVICTGCMTHLGWFFISSGGHHFYGLIADRLVSST